MCPQQGRLSALVIDAACTVHILLHVSGLHEKQPGPVLDKVASLLITTNHRLSISQGKSERDGVKSKGKGTSVPHFPFYLVEAHEQATIQTSIPLTFKDAEIRCDRVSNYRYIPVFEENGITKCGGPRDSFFRNPEMIWLCLVSADKEREGLHEEK